MTAPTPPRVYAEWLPLIERFRDGDDAVLEVMQRGTIEWTNVVAERWTRRIDEALDVRLKHIEKQLQIAFDRAAGDPFSISRAMLGARRSLGPLHGFVALPGIPEEVRTHLAQVLARYVQTKQESLESQAAKFRYDNGRTLKAIRDNPLTVRTAPPPEPDTPDEPLPPLRGRRVIL